MGRKRVFVTGMGIFCPLGVEIKEFWNNLSYGKSGVRDITKFDPSPSLTSVAGIIQNYAPKIYFSPREQRSCEAFVQYGLKVSGVHAPQLATVHSLNARE